MESGKCVALVSRITLRYIQATQFAFYICAASCGELNSKRLTQADKRNSVLRYRSLAFKLETVHYTIEFFS